MAIRTYKVTLDTKNTIAPEPVFLRQGDKTGAVVIDATLMDNGAPISLDGLTPMFKANTADGKAVIADSNGFNIVNASGGEFTYQVPNALSSVPGKITTAYFSFSDSSGSESTFDVAFIIKKAVDITKPQADEYITIIDGTLQSLQQKIDAMNTDVQTILDAFNQGDFYNKTQTDAKDAETLASSKSYTDTQDAATLVSAKTYTDTQAEPKIVSYTIGQSDNTLAPDKITNIDGMIKRVDNNVYLSLHINVSTYAGTSATGALDLMFIPAGYRIDIVTIQYPLATEQNATTQMLRAFIRTTPNGSVISALAAVGNLYISGSWPTSDDFPG